MKNFKRDFKTLKVYFDEVMEKVKLYIDGYEGELPDKLKRIK